MVLPTVRRIVTAAALLGIFCATGCNTPAAVSQYCASSITTLSSVTTVLSDMGPSCLRAMNEITYVPFKAPMTSSPGCDDVNKQQAAAIAAAKLLSEYFSALNTLSTVGSTTPSTDAGTLATNAAEIAGATADQKNAFSSLAQDLTKGIMAGYQYKKLAADLPKAKKNIDNIVAALVAIINNNYLGQLLNDEDKKAADAYKDFLRDNNSPGAILILDQRWQSTEQSVQSKQAAAKNAVKALTTMQAGFDKLADNAATVKPKDVAPLLEPYATELQSLIPQIVKAF